VADTVAAPFALRDARFIISPGTEEEREFSSSVSHALFDPRVTWQTYREYDDAPGLAGASSVVDWWLAIEYPQDWASASSLSLFLAAHAGQERDVLFVPSEALSTHQVRATVILAPGPIGGDAGPVLTGIVAMPVLGEPQLEER
jgi:hypothetical protein